MRRAALVLIAACAALLAGCGSSTDQWAAEQADRLRQAGVTFPDDQERNTVVALAGTCGSKKAGMTLAMYMNTTPRVNDWLSEADAMKMWTLADDQFCASIPDGPLGEGN